MAEQKPQQDPKLQELQFEEIRGLVLDTLQRFEQLAQKLEQLPDDIASTLSERIDVKVEHHAADKVQLEGEPTVSVPQFEALAQRWEGLEAALRELAQAEKSVVVKNAEALKTTVDLTALANEVKEQREAMLKLAEKDVQVVVKSPDDIQATIKNWPKQAKDAIPVVLTSKDRKEFYDAVVAAVSAGYNTYQRLGLGDDPVSASNPLPVTFAGGVTISGPITVSNEVEIKNDTGNPVPTQDTTVAANQNPLDKYRIADEDSLTTTQYYGFVSSTNKNKWYILQIDKTDAVVPIEYHYRYANLSNNGTRTDYGAAGATGAWANRASLTYDYLYNLTGL